MNQHTEVLLPYQKRWIMDESPFALYEKSRQIGISWSLALKAVLKAMQSGRKGRDAWYLGYTEDAGNDFMKYVHEWIRRLNLPLASKEIHDRVNLKLIDSDYDLLTHSVTLSSGYSIASLTAKARNPRGKKGYFIIDEAAFHDDLPGILKSARASTMWGGSINVVSTHFGTESDFCELIDDIQEGKQSGSLHKTTLDDALREGFYNQICVVNGTSWTAEGEKHWRDDLVAFYRDDADEELFCIPNEGGGAYIPRTAIEKCATLSHDGIVRLDARNSVLNDISTRQAIVQAWCDGEIKRRLSAIEGDAFLGCDFARSHDLSVLTIGFKSKDQGVHFPLIVEMRNIPHEAQKQICTYVAKNVRRIGGGGFDATGNGSFLAESMNEQWRSIEPVTITTQWYIDTMPKLRAAFENDKIAIANDPDSIEDIGQIRLHGGIPKLTPLRRTTKSGARHGDYAIALALGYSAAVNSLGPPVFATKATEYRRMVQYERPHF